MPYVRTLRWAARTETVERVEEIVRLLRDKTRTEPGCQVFDVYRAAEDHRVFFVLEVFDDEAAYRTHVEMDYAQQYGRGEVRPLLDSMHSEGFLEL